MNAEATLSAENDALTNERDELKHKTANELQSALKTANEFLTQQTERVQELAAEVRRVKRIAVDWIPWLCGAQCKERTVAEINEAASPAADFEPAVGDDFSSDDIPF